MRKSPPVLVSRLMPTCLRSDRFTSAMRTLRLTCSGVAVFNRFTTQILQTEPSFDMSTPGLRTAETSWAACADSSGEATVPVRTATCPTFITRMAELGMAARRTSSTELMFWLTRTFVA